MSMVADQMVAPSASSTGGWYGAASRHVAQFLNALRCVPASAWHRVSERTPVADEALIPSDAPTALVLEEQADHAARRRLHAALARMPAVVQRIRNRVNADVAIFDGMLPENAVQRMRRAATLAAFALAARPLLSREDVLRLYRPFLDLIPPPRELVQP